MQHLCCIGVIGGKMRKRRFFILTTIIVLSAFLSACGQSKKDYKILEERNVEIINFESDKSHDKLHNMASFWKNFECPEKKVIVDFEESFSFADYLHIFLEAYEESDYGLAYGLVNYVCKKENLCETDEPVTCIVTEDEVFLLDLTKPLFDGVGIDADNAEKIRTYSVCLAEYIVKELGLKVLTDITINKDVDKIASIKNEWLQSLGCEYHYYPSLTISLYDSNDEKKDKYPYCDVTDLYTFFFSLEDINALGYKDYFGSYNRIRNFIEYDFKEAQSKFWKCNEDVEPVKIYTCFEDDNSYLKGKLAGAYYYEDNLINLYVDWNTAESVLLHEYIHYMDKDYSKVPETDMNKKRAMREAYAAEISIYECENRMLKDALLQEGGKDELARLGVLKNDEVDSQYYIELFSKHILEESKGEVFTATGSKNKINSDIIPWYYLPSYANGSFMHYAMKKYGKEKIIDVTKNARDYDELISEDYEALYLEWTSYLDGL